ncbi:MAG: hypothetical protein D6711_01865 [Chloroflexi bacterium]|nr:MAG: hypothetical protein D6711_01865 [Chloroflexota bacterium]
MMKRIFILFVAALVLLGLASPILNNSGVKAQDECSSSGDQTELITLIVNDTDSDIYMNWLDYSCEESQSYFIPAGGSQDLRTYDGHEFIFRDADGNELVHYVVNTLIDGEEVSLKLLLSEGAAAGFMWDYPNLYRDDAGIEPIYYSRALYHILDEAVKQAKAMAEEEGVDFNEFVTRNNNEGLSTIVGIATSLARYEYGDQYSFNWKRTNGGLSFSDGKLRSVDDLVRQLVVNFEDSLETDGDASPWLDPEVQSFAFYSDEYLFLTIFSYSSQPELDMMFEEMVEAELFPPELSE